MSGTEAHPPTHVLAELAEGVLDDAQAREVRAHVDQCLDCQASIDELARVTVSLGALPAELPIPEFVAARISHALAAEQAGGGTTTAASAVGAPGPEGGTVAWFRRRLPQGLAAAASVAVVGLAGYVVVSGGTGGGNDSAGDGGAEVAAGAAPSDSSSIDSQRAGPSVRPYTASGDSFSTTLPDAAQEEDSDVDTAELTAAVATVVQQQSAARLGCGQNLADEQSLPLVGSATDFAGVVVVLDAGNEYEGWLVPTCNSVSTEEIVDHVLVPKPE
ncbi:anti-sigma factor family protein [Jiangella mangrovi]|uniref:Zinc-finger domain-containing protein n=1 Tax=Jiangella mangrovi TaxID=1524084 RepID=A0A7W9GP46_9ACTN|nr:zf-HC2 domain-containing protein [Jiangella mangrovi]MBB5787171.1 hypothetical protein [Jiangella mangrovi]